MDFRLSNVSYKCTIFSKIQYYMKIFSEQGDAKKANKLTNTYTLTHY